MIVSSRRTKEAFWVATIALSLVWFGWGKASAGLTKKDLRRVNDAGPVEIALVFLNPIEKEAGSDIAFQVRMNTHSVNLEAYDMAKVSSLQVDGRPEQKPLGWFKPGGGGHHVSGVLKFSGPIPSDAKSLRVVIRDVGGVPERVFEWQLPLE